MRKTHESGDSLARSHAVLDRSSQGACRGLPTLSARGRIETDKSVRERGARPHRDTEGSPRRDFRRDFRRTHPTPPIRPTRTTKDQDHERQPPSPRLRFRARRPQSLPVVLHGRDAPLDARGTERRRLQLPDRKRHLHAGRPHELTQAFGRADPARSGRARPLLRTRRQDPHPPPGRRREDPARSRTLARRGREDRDGAHLDRNQRPEQQGRVA